MNNFVNSEYDRFEKEKKIKLKEPISTSIIDSTLDFQDIRVAFIATQKGENTTEILLTVYTGTQSDIQEILIKLNDEEIISYKQVANSSFSLGCVITVTDLEKICNANEVEIRIKNSKGHADFTSADIIFGARVMYNAVYNEGAYLEEIQNREKDIAEEKLKKEKIAFEKLSKYKKREERINTIGVNKFFTVDYDKFKQKRTVKQKDELELDSTTGNLMVIHPNIKFRYVHVSDEIPSYLFDFEAVSDSGLNLKNGECILLLNDNERLIFKPNENYSESYMEKYHIESDFYLITEEELVKLCNAHKIEMRVTNGDGYADITTDGIQLAARRFYNAIIDDTAFLDDILTQEERDSIERERIRKERQAKEAEEARIRAEKRAEWFAANKKKVIATILAVIALVIGIIVYHKIAENKRYQQALASAKAYIASGDSCVAIYHFDEAQVFYDKAKRTGAGPTVEYEVSKKESELRNAQNKADQEYNDALRRLKVFLDADDGEFNDISSACLDKMIQIYPDRKETKYFQKLRKK